MNFRTFPVYVLLVTACGPAAPLPEPAPSTTTPDVGVLVMAHGGSGEWNGTIADAVAPLRRHWPVALALGMADSSTLAAGVDSLTEAGVRRITLLRLFVSGTSFLERTDRLLGLTASARARIPGIAHDLHIATHTHGLAPSTQAETILRDRAMELSADPSRESILVLAHGLSGEPENAGLLRLMEAAVQPLRDLGFRDVRVATLREDWADQRRQAEANIRRYVTERRHRGDRVLVLPYRLSGFGPYASVLEGLSYEAGRGFLPHPEVTEWMWETVNAIITAQGWR